jgi:hypothetical protein
MKKENKLTQSQEKLAAHLTCQTLPLRKLVNLLNSRNKNGIGDNRHILVDDYWPEDYSDPKLSDIADKILKEWEQLIGSNFYTDNFRRSDKFQYEKLRIYALDYIYRARGILENIKDTVFEEDIKELEEGIEDISREFKFKNIKTAKDADAKIKQIVQKLELEAEEAKTSKIIIFEDLLTNLQEYFPKIEFKTDITCAMYASWYRKAKLKING